MLTAKRTHATARTLCLAPKTKACKVLLEVWLAWRGDRLLPRHADLDPCDLRTVLPHISVAEIHGPAATIVRLAGTVYRDTLGFELTGLNMVDLSPEADRGIRAYRAWVAATQPCGMHAENRFFYSSSAVDSFEFLTLPLAADGPGSPPMLICAMDSLSGRRWRNNAEISLVHAPYDYFAFLDIGAGVQPPDPPADFLKA